MMQSDIFKTTKKWSKHLFKQAMAHELLIRHLGQYKVLGMLALHLCSSHNAVTHVRNKIVTFKAGHLMW